MMMTITMMSKYAARTAAIHFSTSSRLSSPRLESYDVRVSSTRVLDVESDYVYVFVCSAEAASKQSTRAPLKPSSKSKPAAAATTATATGAATAAAAATPVRSQALLQSGDDSDLSSAESGAATPLSKFRHDHGKQRSSLSAQRKGVVGAISELVAAAKSRETAVANRPMIDAGLAQLLTSQHEASVRQQQLMMDQQIRHQEQQNAMFMALLNRLLPPVPAAAIAPAPNIALAAVAAAAAAEVAAAPLPIPQQQPLLSAVPLQPQVPAVSAVPAIGAMPNVPIARQ
jgi:hypothetical protein